MLTTADMAGRVASQGGRYSRLTLREAIAEQADRSDGALVRLRAGAFSLRPTLPDEVPHAEAPEGMTAVATAALAAMRQLRAGDVTRPTAREVHAQVSLSAAPYSFRAVRQALLVLARDPEVALARPARGCYEVSG